MVIKDIKSPFLFSVQYEGTEKAEYYRLFEEWNDLDYLTDFFEENKEYLNNDFWKNLGSPEEAALRVIEEAKALRKWFHEIIQNSQNGESPDLDSHFKLLHGKKEYEYELTAMKSYGRFHPSLLRMYAIKMGENSYLITGGGIKLGEAIQDSPGIKDHVLQHIARVKNYLKREGIMDQDDLSE